jgi:hypothetical protein
VTVGAVGDVIDPSNPTTGYGATVTDDPFRDPDLVELYDLDNPGGADHDYYRALADDLGARVIVDLGYGVDRVYTNTLYFRTAAQFRAALENAGFTDVTWAGDFRGGPAQQRSPYFVFRAIRSHRRRG